MIFNILFLGLLCLARAHEHHHLQAVYEDPNKDRSIFDTKALTPIKKGRGSLKWAFVSTVSGPDSRRRILLAKIKENKPLENPFAFEWAFEYSDEKGKLQLDVQDVVYQNEKYTLCGRAIADDKRSEGFVIVLDKKGVFKRGRIYPKVESFNSLAPDLFSNSLIAVGQTQKKKGNGRDGVIYTIKNVPNLIPKCIKSFRGVYDKKTFIDSKFNEVIRLNGVPIQFAVVGEMTVGKGKSSNVLVTVVNKKCEVKFKKEYGQLKQNNEYNEEISERGFSIAQLSKKRDLVITGKVRGRKNTDILVFTIDKMGAVKWSKRFDFEKKKDFGTAVQVTEKFEKILVAGETTTDTFKGGSTKRINTKDAFIMELNPNARVVKFELFGLELGLDNGALVPGNLDLHLTKNKNAVGMGNAAISGNKGNVPYLIERYPTVKGVCLHKERDITVKEVQLGTSELQFEELEDKGEKIKLKRKKATLTKREITCPSQFPSSMPSDMPSQAPSFMPSHTPSRTPSENPSPSPSVPNSGGGPSETPTKMPSRMPSQAPSENPSPSPSVPNSGGGPSETPTKMPSRMPSQAPSENSSPSPSVPNSGGGPSETPTKMPSRTPSQAPIENPSLPPEQNSGGGPSHMPSLTF